MSQCRGQSSPFFLRRRTLFSFVTYSATSLLGAVVGLGYYLPKPPSLSESFLINDLRYGGTLAGAFLGAVLAAAIAPRLEPRVIAGKTYMVALLPAVALGILLLKDKAIVGGTTLLLWILPLLFVAVGSRKQSGI